MINLKFKVLIFDLDDTLFDTWETCVRPATSQACHLMIQAGLKATLEQATREAERHLLQFPRRDTFIHLSAHFGVKGITATEISEIGRRAFFERKVEDNITLFPGTREILADLRTRYLVFLVTSGHPKTQEQKVSFLKIKNFFTQIFYVDGGKKEQKTPTFVKIMHQTDTPPEQILCIGDRLDRELVEGKRLGFKTCLLKRRQYLRLLPQEPNEEPDFEIEKLPELVSDCGL